MQLNHHVKVNLSNLESVECFAAWQEIGIFEKRFTTNMKSCFLIV